MIYTHTEKTVKKYTVNQAVEAAKVILKDRKVNKCCITSIQKRDLNQKITLEEMNKITEQIVDDSTFY